MKLAIDAIFENGTFRPVHRELLVMDEGQRVRITIEDSDPESLLLALSVYDGLSNAEIDEVEKIALDRTSFFGSRRES